MSMWRVEASGLNYDIDPISVPDGMDEKAVFEFASQVCNTNGVTVIGVSRL